MGLVVAALIGVVSGKTVQGQPAQNPPPAQQPAAPAQPPPPDPLKFNLDTPVLLINQVKSDKTADFEAAWAAIRAAFAKTDKPEVKAFGETLTKLYKINLGAEAAAQPQLVYILQIDVPSKTFSYNPGKILYETLLGASAVTREEADTIYKKLTESVANINFWPLVKVG